jgi:hypothetical protein
MEKSRDSKLAQELERLYEREFLHKFPYQDCYKLQKLHPRVARALVPDLDLYFSFIAGYGSSATTLHRRSKVELRAALPKLKRSFYEACPKYNRLAKYITDSETPTLFHDLEVSDRLRFGLATLIAEFI